MVNSLPQTFSHAPCPRVSIGLPVFNGGSYLILALDSLLAQTFRDFELIISDNDSSDQTESICRDYARRDKRVRYVRQSSNIGATANFNYVLDQARAPYFMWAAHDDIWEPDFLAELTSMMEADPEAELAFCRFDNVSYAEAKSNRMFDLKDMVGRTVADGLIKFIMHPEYNGKANAFYGLLRTQTVRGLGGVRIWGKTVWGADMLYVFSILMNGRLVLSDRFLFHKRSAPPVENPPDLSGMPHWQRLRIELSQRKQESIDWMGYWIGYWRILNQVSGRLQSERWTLRWMVIERAFKRMRILAACKVGLRWPAVYDRWLAKRIAVWIDA